jgi:hypothetical protein
VVLYVERIIIGRTILNKHQESVAVVVTVPVPNPGSVTSIVSIPPVVTITEVESVAVVERIVITISVSTIVISVVQRVPVTVSQRCFALWQIVIVVPTWTISPDRITTVIPVVIKTTVVVRAVQITARIILTTVHRHKVSTVPARVGDASVATNFRKVSTRVSRVYAVRHPAITPVPIPPRLLITGILMN